MAITAPRGTQDFLPEQTAEWQLLEAKIRQICSLYGFGEIRTPMFESTELFLRGIGETTDVVTKEIIPLKTAAAAADIAPGKYGFCRPGLPGTQALRRPAGPQVLLHGPHVPS